MYLDAFSNALGKDTIVMLLGQLSNMMSEKVPNTALYTNVAEECLIKVHYIVKVKKRILE